MFDDLQARFDKEIVARSAREFVAAKLAERDSRIKRIGASRYVVEPNVKEGKGGLRDLNTLFWIAKYVYRVRDTHELVGAGLFTAKEFALFRRCEEFLWAVRCHLHFLTGRPEERLSFDLQRPIAEQLGYTPRAGLTDVERFMKHYFLIAKDVGDLTAIVCAALEERQAKPRPVLDRFIGRLRRRSSVIADAKDFKIEFDRISVVRSDVFERDPVNLIRLFWVADRSNLAIHPDATRLVTHSLKRIDADLRNDPEANRLFLEILTSRHSPEIVLRHMNEAGVLGRFIPDFGRIVGMMQFSMYHHYTVDEHLLRTIGVLAKIEAGRLVEDHPLVSEFLPVDRQPHDPLCRRFPARHRQGPARGSFDRRSGSGAPPLSALRPFPGRDRNRRLADRAASDDVDNGAEPRSLGPAHDRDLRRHRADARTPQNAAGADGLRHSRGRPRRLERLEGPAPAHPISGKPKSCSAAAIPRSTASRASPWRKRRCAAALPGWSDPDFEAYAARHYPAYWLKVDLARQIAQAKLLYAMASEVRSLATEVATDAFRGVTELTIVAPDHPRLLSIIAGVCASAGGNIVDAQIFTTTDGLALDTIFLSRAFERDADELRRADRIAEASRRRCAARFAWARWSPPSAGPTRAPKPSLWRPM